jgi:2-dehydro-3-deoxy-D-arabinonate dehydratase
MIKFINYFDKVDNSRNGIVVDDKVYDISSYYPKSLINLISDGNLNNEAFHNELIGNLDKFAKSDYTFSELQSSNKDDSFGLNIPYVPNEVWACGVTYKKNMELHEQDIEESNGFKGLYSYVYDSQRPEIFFKALGHHCVGTNKYITIRSDSDETFIEAELALIFNSKGDVIGYTAANDITAWDIEKECPLFLNQAKIFKGSCVLGPCVVPERFIQSPLNLDVNCKLIRNGELIYEGKGSTKNMKRSIAEFKDYLFRDNVISNGTVFCTGTAIGIPNNMFINDGDLCHIEVDKIGFIKNLAKKVKINN